MGDLSKIKQLPTGQAGSSPCPMAIRSPEPASPRAHQFISGISSLSPFGALHNDLSNIGCISGKTYSTHYLKTLMGNQRKKKVVFALKEGGFQSSPSE
jgi:hypothetical protein